MHRFVLACLLLTLCACQRPAMVMPTMFKAGQVAPLADTPAPWRTNTHTIFYATDRQFDPSDNPRGIYNHRRNDALALGTLSIHLGQDHAWQALHAATQNQPNGKQPYPTLEAIKPLGQMQWGPAGRIEHPIDPPTEHAFIEQLDAALKQSNGKTITIYTHGFKTSFEEAALTAAEISLYSGGLGPLVLYSWPSLDNLLEYSHDRDSVRYTTAHARRFIEMLASEIAAGHLDANQINLIAHSSGAEVVGSVLRELGLMSHQLTPEQRREKWRINQVILIAPDISTDVARERILKEDLRGMYQQIVAYTSPKDSALQWASRFLYRTPRIGSLEESHLTDADRDWLGRAENVTLVSVDAQPNGDPALHSHHRYSGATLSDILLCLRSDLTPEQRGLTRKAGDIIWHFADNYQQRATQAAAKVYPKADQP